MAIEEGKAAPAFTLKNQDGEQVSLPDFTGGNPAKALEALGDG